MKGSFVVFWLCLFVLLKSFAKEDVFEELIDSTELCLMQEEMKEFGREDFYLPNSLSKFSKDEFKIALSMLFFTSSDFKNEKIRFKDLSQMYLLSSELRKREMLLSKIKSYIWYFEENIHNLKLKRGEIEEMVWFFLIIENANLINFLDEKKITVQEFIQKITKEHNFKIFKNLVYAVKDKASDLLWKGKIDEALLIIPEVQNKNERDELLARVFFQTKNPKYATNAHRIITKQDFKDEGVVHDYIGYLANTEHYKEALTLISKAKLNLEGEHAGKFWNLIESLFFHYMKEGEYVYAYELVSRLNLSEDRNPKIFARAKFLAGFTALKFLNEPQIALIHFMPLYNLKNLDVYAKARGAYFIAQSNKALKKNEEAKQWLTKASKFVNTLYGMLAIEEINQVEPVLFLGSKNYTELSIESNLKKRDAIHKFYFDEFFASYYKNYNPASIEKLSENLPFKVGLIMIHLNKILMATDFFGVSKAEMTAPEIKLAFDLLGKYFEQHQISSGKNILEAFSNKASNKGVIFLENYPVIDFIVKNNSSLQKSLVHAIIKKESKFINKASSHQGALGLMQVTPSTGRAVSKSINLKFDQNKLRTDYKYNIKIGSSYLDELLKRFGGSYFYSLIGYNAGPSRVSSWKTRYFEPQTLYDAVSFIELIPTPETRDYVLRVLEDEAIYSYLIKNHLKAKSPFPVRNWSSK